MKKLLLILLASLSSFGLVIQDAEAKRLGGSRSFGISRDTPAVKQAAPTAPTAAPSSAVAAPKASPTAPGGNRWLGPIAGLAAGIGLAALMSHLGFGEGFASILMLALMVGLAVMAFRWFFGRRTAQPAYAGGGPAAPARFEAPVMTGSAPAAANVPAGFDTDGFIRQARLNFIRLQAANDAGNLDDLKQFTSPEVFAELRMQIEERGPGNQETDVQQLEAVLLEMVSEPERHVASVRFSGQIKEEAQGPAQYFAEIWHLTKPANGGGWVVAGIQQIQ